MSANAAAALERDSERIGIERVHVDFYLFLVFFFAAKYFSPGVYETISNASE